MNFTIPICLEFQFGGTQISAPPGKVFVPGLLCQLIVTICTELHVLFAFLYYIITNFTLNEIYWHEIIKIASNCVVLTCAGITDGQLMVFSDPKKVFKSIQFVAMATNPILGKLINIFEDMIEEKFAN